MDIDSFLTLTMVLLTDESLLTLLPGSRESLQAIFSLWRIVSKGFTVATWSLDLISDQDSNAVRTLVHKELSNL